MPAPSKIKAKGGPLLAYFLFSEDSARLLRASGALGESMIEMKLTTRTSLKKEDCEANLRSTFEVIFEAMIAILELPRTSHLLDRTRSS